MGSTPIARSFCAMKVIAVKPDSPLFGYVRKGYELIRINGEDIRDKLDCLFELSEEWSILEFRDKSGRERKVKIRNEYNPDIGLEFEPDKIKICRNKCIFCFIHQQPKGMRRALYVRDDDYRLSFTHGNFISLSNLTDDDYSRITRQRLSPLYVSVHTTDDNLRRMMFGNKKLPPILPRLKSLVDNGIIVHTQIVLMPNINDDAHLKKTVDELAGLYPGVASIGVVPVGLTRYRKNLPRLDRYDSTNSIPVLEYIHKKQRDFLKKQGSRIIYSADEFYILSGAELPRSAEYEDMPQFENGIGMMRYTLTDFNRKRRFLRKFTSGKKRIALITGVLAFDILKNKIICELKTKTGFNVDIFPIPNRFWGETVTVSGLLTGKDILAGIKGLERRYDVIILPPNCLNDDNFFLDDISLDELKNKTRADIRVGSYSVADSLKEVLS